MPETENAVSERLLSEASGALRASLVREDAVYAELLDLAGRQQEALVARNIDSLNEIVHRQGTLLREADGLDVAGCDAVETLARALNLPEDATLSDVAGRLDSHEAAPLIALRDRIAASADSLARANWVNRQLLESAMDMVRFTVQIFADSVREPDACYPAGEPESRAASLVLDQLA